MNVQILALLILVCMFVIASFFPINLGILALVAAFVVGVGFGGLDIDTIIGGFPGTLFILIVGVTYLFALAQENGTLQRIIDVSMRLVGHRVGAVPWLMFLLAAFVAAAGALSAASVAIVAPIALRFAAQHKVSPLLMGLMVVQGATAGSFSPLSPFGAITNGLLTGNGLPSEPMGLFVNSMLFNLVLACVVFAAFGGLSLLRQRRLQAHVAASSGVTALAGAGDRFAAMPPPPPADLAARDDNTRAGTTATIGSGPGSVRAAGSAGGSDDDSKGEEQRALRVGDTVHQVATLIAIIGLVASTMLLDLDVGFMALTLAVGLTLLSPNRYGECVKRLPWSAVLLVCGVLTYVGVLSEIGTIDYLSDLITSTGSPLLTALAACYIGGVISAFASTAGVLGASIPLAVPVIEGGMLPLLGTVSAIGIASSVVDVSPLSTNGALLVANQKSMEPRLFFRRLLLWSAIVIAIAPFLSWLIFVVL